jgi:hypothetical protein
MPAGAGSQLFDGMKPIFIRRSPRTAPRMPQLKREGRGLVMPEGRDAMSNRSCMTMFMGFRGVLVFLPGVLTPRQMLLFSVQLGNALGMYRATE